MESIGATVHTRIPAVRAPGATTVFVCGAPLLNGGRHGFMVGHI